jgi:hypothetical protein
MSLAPERRRCGGEQARSLDGVILPSAISAPARSIARGKCPSSYTISRASGSFSRSKSLRAVLSSIFSSLRFTTAMLSSTKLRLVSKMVPRPVFGKYTLLQVTRSRSVSEREIIGVVEDKQPFVVALKPLKSLNHMRESIGGGTVRPGRLSIRAAVAKVPCKASPCRPPSRKCIGICPYFPNRTRERPGISLCLRVRRWPWG